MGKKEKCGKKSQCEFHQLTKEIMKLQYERNKLYKKNIAKYDTDKHCSICLCFNPKYTIPTDGGDLSNLCSYCVESVQKVKCPKKSPYEYECPVCGDTDGIYIINGLTNNLCVDCLDEINKLKIC